jgi:RNA polymerase sigma-70 factor (ECF subfamily)
MGPHTEPSDERLAVLSEQGNQEAVSELVRRHSPGLYSFIQRYHPDRDDADDLLQETWIRALAHLDRFDPSRRLSTWLFQIALNLCRDLARRDQVRSRFRRDVQEMQQGKMSAKVEETVDARKIVQAIEALQPQQKEALLLRYYQGFSEAEASEILGCPKGTVKSRLHQAVKTLRGQLGTMEVEP